MLAILSKLRIKKEALTAHQIAEIIGPNAQDDMATV
jgi:hypothetical protein